MLNYISVFTIYFRSVFNNFPPGYICHQIGVHCHQYRKFVLCKLEHEGSSQTGASIAKTVTITEDLIWSLHIHGQKLNASKCKALSYVRDKVPTKTAMSQLLTIIGNLSVFPENLNCHFLALADSHKGNFHSPFKGTAAFIDSYLPVKFEEEI